MSNKKMVLHIDQLTKKDADAVRNSCVQNGQNLTQIGLDEYEFTPDMDWPECHNQEMTSFLRRYADAGFDFEINISFA